jgi:hypothetical protein
MISILVKGHSCYLLCVEGAGELRPLLALPLRSVLLLLTELAPTFPAAPCTKFRINPLYISASALCDSLCER